jgi:hypothetical protein
MSRYRGITLLGPAGRIWRRVRYRTLIEEFLTRLGRRGLRIELKYISLEGGVPPWKPIWDYDEYEFGFLKPEDVGAIIAKSERRLVKEKVLGRLHEGKRCFVLKHRNSIVSYVWCNFTTCHARGREFPLGGNEAYLFDSYTSRNYRGKDLAPFVRCRLYQELSKMGKTRYYSATSLFNSPSLNFKAKIGAVPIELFLYVCLFGRWERQWSIKNYTNNLPVN